MPEKILFRKGINGKHKESAATITINNPEKNNLIDDKMLSEFIAAIDMAREEGELKLLVIDSNGENFCAGRDSSGDNVTLKGFKSSISNIISLNRSISLLNCVSLSLVQGKAAGMGAGIAVQTDLTLASENATFSFTEMNHGLPPAIVLSYIGRWLPKKKANEMVFTGRAFDAKEAEKFFLVNEVVEQDKLYDSAYKWAEIICSKDKDAIRVCKKYLRGSLDLSIDESTDYALLSMVDWKSLKSA